MRQPSRLKGTWRDKTLSLEERMSLYEEACKARDNEPVFSMWDSPIGGIGVAVGLCLGLLIIMAVLA